MNCSSTKKHNNLKALILAGGRGKRLGEVTEEQNKCLYVFKEKPLIEYSLENATILGIDEIIVVVGHLAESIIDKYGNKYKDASIKYAIQKEQQGLVHAIACAEKKIGDSDFVLFLGDEFLITPQHETMIDTFYKEEAFTVCGVIDVKDRTLVGKTYSILFDRESKMIYRLIEKPQNPTNNFMGTGNIIFRNQILSYLDKTPINQKRNERELPDLVQCAIDDGKKILYHPIASQYVNVNTPEDILLLKNQENSAEDK